MGGSSAVHTAPLAAGNDTAVDKMYLEASLNCLHLVMA